MYTRRIYRFRDMLRWSRFEIYKFILIGFSAVFVYHVLGLNWFEIPLVPISLLGTAVAFVIGFQNNASYGRIWEARKIWGGIVNTSRTFGMFTQDMVTNEYASQKVDETELKSEIKTLVYRHIGWMTSLRYAMREDRPWEAVLKERSNKEWLKRLQPPEFTSELKDELNPYLSEQDMDYVMSKGNKQTAVLYLQSKHLRKLKEKGLIWEFSFLQLESVLEELFALQGKSERIKNFPYPRQFATLNHYFLWIFVILLPFGLVHEFEKLAEHLESHLEYAKHIIPWLFVPTYTLIAWVFHTMERIGRTGYNPFEGSGNDVPISTIARGIEIDLRQNLGENKDEIPAQFETLYDIQF